MGRKRMDHECRPTLNYEAPATARRASRFGEDVCLLGTFLLYVLTNLVMVEFSTAGRVFGVMFAFTVPLPLLFIALVLLVRYLVNPPLFSRAVLVTFIVLVLIGAAFNAHVFAEALAGV